MTAQRVDVNILDGFAIKHVVPIHAAAAGRAAELNPVGSFVCGSLVTCTFNQGLQQQRPIAIQSFPVFGQALSRERKDFAGKPANGNVRRNQEATIRNDELEVPFALFGAPADPGIALRHLPCRTRKLQAGKITPGQFFRRDDITSVSAKRNFVAKVMPAFDELFENRGKLAVGSLDKLQGQWFELAGAAGDRRLRFDMCGCIHLTRSGRAGGAKLGDGDDPVGVEPFQQRTAFLPLEFSVRPFPFQQFTKGPGQFGEAQAGKGPGGLANETDFIRSKGSTG